MAETATPALNTDTDLFRATARDGRIRANNSGICVEESYPICYNLGSGRSPWPGWINVDSGDGADLTADLRNLSMIPSDSADAVAAIHVFEHFYRWESEPLLIEWKRILKPGGKLILEMPSLDKVLNYITYCVLNKQMIYDFMALNAFHGDPRHQDPLMCHRWTYSKSALRTILETVGFTSIQFEKPRYHFEMRDMRCECIK